VIVEASLDRYNRLPPARRIGVDDMVAVPVIDRDGECLFTVDAEKCDALSALYGSA
jgi:hypothetical protein